MVEVVAALIRDGDRILICQRPKDKARGLLWEYVGGKVDPEEDSTRNKSYYDGIYEYLLSCGIEELP